MSKILEKWRSKLTVPTKRPRGSDVKSNEQKRRDKFCTELEKEVKNIGKSQSKEPGKRIKANTWHDKGKWYFTPRYGSVAVNILDDKSQVAVDTPAELRSFIKDLIKATKAGHLDGALEAAATKKPRKEKPKDKPPAKPKAA